MTSIVASHPTDERGDDDDDDNNNDIRPPDWKRLKEDHPTNREQEQTALVERSNNTTAPMTSYSSLPSPTMQLTGHTGSIYSLAYSPSGHALCSTSFDMTCLLWSHTDAYVNYNVLKGHKNAVLDCAWASDTVIATCSADTTIQVWDATTGQRIRKWAKQQQGGGHDKIVNAISSHPASQPNVLVSASDDTKVYCWDIRQKQPAGVLSGDFAVTAVALTDPTTTHQVLSGGIDNMITCWDMKMQRKLYDIRGRHSDTITCLTLSPIGDTHVLSNSMDQTLQIFDLRPFVTGQQRHVKTFRGHSHAADKGLLQCAWNGSATMVSAGSADRIVHVWDEYSTEELYHLPGHKGCVNAVAFHPTEPVLVSGSSDKTMFVGELS